ncbi:type IV secretory system conjugative DNA transfer family protein [Actinopolyspora halophila]|uniref:type IV secretory system conjugative DNA transfer family protein n=1 Tax=Actinopolyspora halophila TaxID=1850 RepID=UPI00037EFC04|nr:type IV secretory system conjugative DNA transfer family protein [Actinopolyspora halophila]
MTGSPARRPGWLEQFGLLAAACLALAVVLAVWAAAAVVGADVPANPFAYTIGLATGEYAWPGLAATLALAGLALALLTAGLTVGLWAWRRRSPPTEGRIDRAARLLAGPRELAPVSPSGVASSAARLRPTSTVPPEQPGEHGRLLGHTVVGDMPVRASWEDLAVHIWGPRRGKTTALTVPAVLEHPGPVVATSNKRDLPDATRGSRGQRGRVWVFDPQQVATEPPSWWYDPLSRVRSIRDAQVLAGHFVAASRDPNAATDAYFDTAAENLLAAYLLAAACSQQASLDTVYRWVANPRNTDPQKLLDTAGNELVAADVEAIRNAPDKQRQGVFDSAKNLLACLRDPDIRTWVTPPTDGEDRPRFDPAAFVDSADTLYCLSREGAGSAAPLVAALTEHVATAAVEAAATRASGRLDPPLYCCLDEAANVVRWRDLPNLYSHLGSRGIVVDTILQSWAQGTEAWGKGDFQKLWSAATIRTYGGGASDVEFLRSLASLAGEYEHESWSASYDRGTRSRSVSTRREQVLTPELLAAMPTGRVLVLAAGCPPFLAAPRPWMHSQHAGTVRASLAEHDPGTTRARP